MKLEYCHHEDHGQDQKDPDEDQDAEDDPEDAKHQTKDTPNQSGDKAEYPLYHTKNETEETFN